MTRFTRSKYEINPYICLKISERIKIWSYRNFIPVLSINHLSRLGAIEIESRLRRCKIFRCSTWRRAGPLLRRAKRHREKNISLKGREEMKGRASWGRRGEEGRKFHENEKKERIFPIPSSTSRTLIRRSGFTLTPGDPFPAPSSLLSHRYSFPVYLASFSVSPYFISLLPSSGISAVFEEELVTSRAFQIPLGVTGSAVAMLLSSRKKQMYGYFEEGQESTRRKYKGTGRERKEKDGEYDQRKAIAAKSFSSRRRHVHVASFLRFIQHTELIAGDIRGE